MKGVLIMVNSNKIYFFYPSKIVGGAEYLFSRLALYLQDVLKKDVYYIDYIDGFIRNQENFKRLKFIDFDDNVKTKILSDGILITPISNIYRITDYLDIINENLKLFLWSIHPCNLIHITPEAEVLQHFSAKQNKLILKFVANNTYKILRKLLYAFSNEKAIYYMDYDNFIFNKTIWDDIVKEDYLKIAIEEKSVFAKDSIINENEINIAVLGRLSEEKITSVINVANNLNLLKTNKKKRLHIIGDGIFKKHFNPKLYPSLEIIFTGTLLNNSMNDYLINNVDILFAMGTSCLEGATLKLPTVVIPYSYKPYELTTFYYFGDIEQNDIGSCYDFYKNHTTIAFDDIINQVYNYDYKSIIGNKCYQYFSKNYSLKAITTLLLKYLDNDSLTFKKYFYIKKQAGVFKRNRNIFYKILRRYIRAKQK